MCFFLQCGSWFVIILSWVVIWLMYHLMFSFNKYFLSDLCVPRTVLLAGTADMSKTRFGSFPCGVYSPVGRKQIKIWFQCAISVIRKGVKRVPWQRSVERSNQTEPPRRRELWEKRMVGRASKKEGSTGKAPNPGSQGVWGSGRHEGAVCVRGEGHEMRKTDGQGQSGLTDRDTKPGQSSWVPEGSTGVDNMAVGGGLNSIFQQWPDCRTLRTRWMVRN